jgi:methylthioribose-1-phosphate isomerase
MRPIEWLGDHVRLIDQRLLPQELVWVECHLPEEFASAIRDMLIRGAPAIGICAAYGLAAAALQGLSLEPVAELLASTRPTAVNLFWAIQRMRLRWQAGASAQDLVREACAIHEEDVLTCQSIGAHGASLFDKPVRVLTHCNAGALATGDFGTALGVVRALHQRGLLTFCWVDETRPYWQGARLTAWELMTERIPCKLICDNMAGHFMQRGQVDAVVVGADRITREGDVANKIGTSTLAVLCKEYGIPFYVAAPWSTLDLELASGWDIPIEERNSQEITHWRGSAVAPEGVEVANPAFDVTFHPYVSGIITERGVLRAPYAESILRARDLSIA